MRIFFLAALFLFGTPAFPKTDPEKVLNCTEKGCSCQGSKCKSVDSRVIAEASTVVVTCSDQSCGQKIVYFLKDEFGCKASAQKLRDLDYVINSECMIIQTDGPVKCPQTTEPKSVQNLIDICLKKEAVSP